MNQKDPTNMPVHPLRIATATTTLLIAIFQYFFEGRLLNLLTTLSPAMGYIIGFFIQEVFIPHFRKQRYNQTRYFYIRARNDAVASDDLIRKIELDNELESLEREELNFTKNHYFSTWWR